MKLSPVIGLEIHLQLKTASKMFCSCPAREAVAPNTNICPVCTAQPGALPVPNEQAVRWIVRTGLALGCSIAPFSKFDRKHYFYPDLPKGYQISQYDLPIAREGFLEVDAPGGKRARIRIGITRVHLEEDAAKSFHSTEGDVEKTFVDFNRSGIPLIEVVTEPDFRSPHETKAFLQELRLIARSLGVSDADMEKGQLRCDANISLREVDEEGLPLKETLNPKTEIKNINSFKAVERALAYEIQRQTKLWEAGTPPVVSSTRGWNDTKQITEPQREKEGAEDYRYFPEPDIPPLELATITDEEKARLSELPAARRERFMDEFLLDSVDARLLCDDPRLADYAEHVFSELEDWITSLEAAGEEKVEQNRKRLAKLVSGWLTSKLGGLLNERNLTIENLKIDPENFAEFITLLANGKLSTSNGIVVLTEMLETGKDPSQIMEDRQLDLISDEQTISDAVKRVLNQNQQEVTRYQAGEKQLLKFFIGMIMKETEGKADPGMAQNLLLIQLEEKP